MSIRHKQKECSGGRQGKKRQRDRRSKNPQRGFDERELIGFPTPPDEEYGLKSQHIGPELKMRFFRNDDLKDSVLSALRALSSELPEAELKTRVEHDRQAPEHSRIVLEVSADYDDVEEYSEIKGIVREVVRGSEVGDEMIYTRINREE